MAQSSDRDIRLDGVLALHALANADERGATAVRERCSEALLGIAYRSFGVSDGELLEIIGTTLGNAGLANEVKQKEDADRQRREAICDAIAAELESEDTH